MPGVLLPASDLLSKPEINSCHNVYPGHREVIVFCGCFAAIEITIGVAIGLIFLIKYIVYLQNDIHFFQRLVAELV